MEMLTTIAVIAVAAPLYVLPVIIGRNHPHVTGIALLTLLLGWTVLGWIGALVWAAVPPRQQQTGTPQGWYQNPADPPAMHRWWDGQRWTEQTWQSIG